MGSGGDKMTNMAARKTTVNTRGLSIERFVLVGDAGLDPTDGITVSVQ